MRALAILAGLSVAAPPLAAQSRLSFIAAGDGEMIRVRSEAAAARTASSGPSAGGEGRLTAGRVALILAYREGRLRPEGGGAPSSDLVEGRVQVEFRLLPWLVVGAGPYARALLAPAGAERRMVWPVRARLDAPLVGAAVTTSVELWRSVGGANDGASLQGARGGAVGLAWHVPGSRFRARLGYRIDQVTMGGDRRESLEGIGFSLGIGPRQP